MLLGFLVCGAGQIINSVTPLGKGGSGVVRVVPLAGPTSHVCSYGGRRMKKWHKEKGST